MYLHLKLLTNNFFYLRKHKRSYLDVFVSYDYFKNKEQEKKESLLR